VCSTVEERLAEIGRAIDEVAAAAAAPGAGLDDLAARLAQIWAPARLYVGHGLTPALPWHPGRA